MSDFESDLRELTERAQEQIRNLQEQQEAIRMAKGKGFSADRMVRAAIDSSGVLRSLRIDPRAMRLGSEALCDSILEAVGAAHENLREVLQELMPSRGEVDISGLMRKVELPGELRGIVDQLNRRVSDIDYDIERFRKTIR